MLHKGWLGQQTDDPIWRIILENCRNPSVLMAEISKFLNSGLEIAGSAAVPVLSVAFGDITGGALAQAGIVISKELSDHVLRSLSKREEARSAGAILIAAEKIKSRLDAGDALRDDDFFRIRIGQEPDARKVVEGILTKSRNQYEERKVFALANFFAELSFNKELSSDDACWYLNVIDSLSYRSLLILAAFHALPGPLWNDGNINIICGRDFHIYLQINELRNMNLLSGRSTFSADITLTDAGRILVEYCGLIEELELYGDAVKHVVGNKTI